MGGSGDPGCVMVAGLGVRTSVYLPFNPLNAASNIGIFK